MTRTGLLLSLLSCLTAGPGRALLVEPPGAIAENAHPFAANPIIETRYQQVYRSDLFPGRVVIGALTFFPSTPKTRVAAAVYEVRISTTPQAVNHLDVSNLDANVGADEQLFFSGFLEGHYFPALRLEGEPFLYNPAAGNLLVEIRVGPASGNFGGFDAGNGTFGDLSSRASNWIAGFTSYGLVTDFELSAVLSIDVKPGSCPNAFNPRGRGLVPVAIAGTEALDVQRIDPASVEFCAAHDPGRIAACVRPYDGPPGPHATIDDVTSPVVASETCACANTGPDGVDDLLLHFRSEEIAEALGRKEVEGGDVVEFFVRARLADGDEGSGSDCLRVTPPGLDPRRQRLRSRHVR